MYTLEQIRSIVDGSWQQYVNDAGIDYLLADSRNVLFPGASLFFALSGPRRNGHDFIDEAYAKGVRNFIVSSASTTLPADANIILVNDVLLALQQLAAWHRAQFLLPVIGITGSNGKTIVKEWLNQLLETSFTIVRSPKSYNSQLGVPFSVWQMNSRHTLGIFEAGISQRQEMARLAAIIRPTIGIFTNLGEAHSEGFGSLEEKAKEKLLLFRGCNVLIYCKDYPALNKIIPAFVENEAIHNNAVALFSWSKTTDAVFRVDAIKVESLFSDITATYKSAVISFRLPFTDSASIDNAISCYCALLQLGFDHHFIQEGLQALRPVAMRLELKKGINNCSIINDSYSADLSSLRIALDFLFRQQQHTKKTVILSDIPETGREETALYAEVMAMLRDKKIDRLIGIGPALMRQQHMADKLGLGDHRFYASTDAFLQDFFHLKFQQEAILLKGARVFAFEQILLLLEKQVHQTVMEINLNDVLHNLRQYQQVISPSTKIMAMVKAASYGSGSFEIASLLQFHKADYLAVAYADEGIELRKAGITLPVMVMNPEPGTFDALVQYKLEPDIYSFELLQLFQGFVKQEGLLQYPVHIELETGMNRLGFPVSSDNMHRLANELLSGACRLQSVFTHLAASEDPDSTTFTLQQATLYSSAVAILQQKITYPFTRHIANSAAIIRFPQLQLDMVRLGIGLYGIDSAASKLLDLREVSTLTTTIAQVKKLKKGETIGYGRKGVAATADTSIATVRLGYADGYPRRLSNGVGHMLVNGKPAPVIGMISMDMTMLDVTGLGPVTAGDQVLVFGKQLSVQTIAAWAKTIPYEIMAGISQRVKRVYFEE